MSTKRARESLAAAATATETTEPPTKRSRQGVAEQTHALQKDAPTQVAATKLTAENVNSKIINHNDDAGDSGSMSTFFDEDELSQSFSEDENADENVLLDWFKQAKAEGILNPKEVLREQGILDDQAQLDFLNDDQAWDILHRSIRIFSQHVRCQPAAPPRQRLPHIHTVEHTVSLIRDAKKIVVLTGAGISVSCGIPDFRSADGLYKMIESKFDLPDPQALFDIRFFADDPEPFFQFAKNIFPGTFSPSLGHRFIKMLQDKGKLLRNYTQNIDTLEQVAGITECLECHGSFRTASCFSCKTQVPCETIREEIMNQDIPRCTKCSHENNVMKPDIVFFGEGLPSKFGPQLLDDLQVVDLLIVIGSSLRVRPVCTVPARVSPNVPQILINRERVGRPHQFDVELLGNCDTIVAHLLTKLGWAIPGPASKDLAQKAAQDPDHLPPNTYIFEGGIRPLAPQSSNDDDDDDDSGDDDGGDDDDRLVDQKPTT